MIKALFQRLIYRQPHIEKNTLITHEDDINWHSHCDLLIAGFGGAGAAAALEAHAQGLDALIIDRFEGGGSTIISGGVFYAGGGTSTQKSAHIDDDSDNMYRYLQQEVKGAVSDETLQRFCNDSVENHDWMVAHGVPFEPSMCPFKTSYPPNQYFFYYSGNESFKPYSDSAKPAARGHRAKQKGVSGKAIYQPLKQSIIDKGIRQQYHSKLIGLITMKDSHGESRVIGAKVLQLPTHSFAKFAHQLLNQCHGLLRYMALYYPPLFPFFAQLTESIELRFANPQYIRASKGVVLATGGFYSNQKMVQQYAPKFVGGSPLGTLTDDGSGIQIAMNLGAKTQLMDSVSAWRFINPPMAFTRGILIGPSGKRICNEMLYGAQVGEIMMQEHQGKAWIIIDRQTYKQAFADLTLKKGLWFHAMLGAMYLTLSIKKSDSLSILANTLSIDSDAMLQSIRDYNEIANSEQLDPMGKPKSHMPALGDGPYYAINASYDNFFVPCPSLTFGGLAVDEQSGLVLNQQDQAIAGLYAAGRTASGIPSKSYVSGLSIADCIFSGRRAANHAANSQKIK